MKIRSKKCFLYRAISDEELEDIEIYGIRNRPGAYETVKLFALEYEDAVSFGKINQLYDALPFTVIRVAVPNKVFEQSFLFEADGMQAISIEEKYLNLLKIVS